MLSVSCFCMALVFEAWWEGIERTKFLWMGPAIFTFILGAVFFFEAKIASKKKSFVVENTPWKHCLIIAIDTGYG